MFITHMNVQSGYNTSQDWFKRPKVAVRNKNVQPTQNIQSEHISSGQEDQNAEDNHNTNLPFWICLQVHTQT